jgi:hypothetical protein
LGFNFLIADCKSATDGINDILGGDGGERSFKGFESVFRGFSMIEDSSIGFEISKKLILISNGIGLYLI